MVTLTLALTREETAEFYREGRELWRGVTAHKA